jgi:hypothetical protein
MRHQGRKIAGNWSKKPLLELLQQERSKKDRIGN